jgi:hypothetical protein
MNYNFQKTHIKVGLRKYFNSYEKASFIVFGKCWNNSSQNLEFAHAQNQPLIFETNSKGSSGGVCCSWHWIWTRDVKSPCPKYWTLKVIGFGVREKQWISFFDDGMCFVVGLRTILDSLFISGDVWPNFALGLGGVMRQVECQNPICHEWWWMN